MEQWSAENENSGEPQQEMVTKLFVQINIDPRDIQTRLILR